VICTSIERGKKVSSYSKTPRKKITSRTCRISSTWTVRYNTTIQTIPNWGPCVTETWNSDEHKVPDFRDAELVLGQGPFVRGPSVQGPCVSIYHPCCKPFLDGKNLYHSLNVHPFS